MTKVHAKFRGWTGSLLVLLFVTIGGVLACMPMNCRTLGRIGMGLIPLEVIVVVLYGMWDESKELQELQPPVASTKP